MILEHLIYDSFEKKNDWDGEIKQSYIFLKRK